MKQQVLETYLFQKRFSESECHLDSPRKLSVIKYYNISTKICQVSIVRI